jgi:hypothetical protein
MKIQSTQTTQFNVFSINKTIISGYKALQMACYPLAVSESCCKSASSITVRLTVAVDGEITDILEQDWLHDNNTKPDIKIAEHLVGVESHGYGYKNKDDFIDDCLNEGEIESKTQVIESTVTLTLELIEK